MTEITGFTPVSAAIGGVLVGLGATVLLAGVGRISGISGILNQATSSAISQNGWRWGFILGLIMAAAGTYWLAGIQFEPRSGFPLWLLIPAGLLVGFGTALGSGCTSGHGLCGAARFSRRSITATVIFMTVALLTTYTIRHLLAVQA